MLEVPTNDTLRSDLVRAGVDPSDQGVGKLTMHSLRGGLSTGLKDLGVSLSLRQAAMRHSSPLLTENTYTDLHEGELDAAIDRLGAVLAPAIAPDRRPNVVAPTDAPKGRARSTQPVSIRPKAAASARRGKARQG